MATKSTKGTKEDRSGTNHRDTETQRKPIQRKTEALNSSLCFLSFSVSLCLCGSFLFCLGFLLCFFVAILFCLALAVFSLLLEERIHKSVGVEYFQVVELLADADELHR